MKRAKHNPGVWVLYFALIAFPLFGLGQLVIPDQDQRSLAFWMLVTYLGCALALLMTTSLLGMRRYLRQRGAVMPTDITARWLAVGLALTLGVLLLCMLLPLPGRSLSIAGMSIAWDSPANLPSSRFGIGNVGQQSGDQGATTESDPPSDDAQDNAQNNNAEANNAAPNNGEPKNGAPNNGEPQAGEPQAGEPQAGQSREPPGSQSGSNANDQAGSAPGGQAKSAGQPASQANNQRSAEARDVKQPQSQTDRQPDSPSKSQSSNQRSDQPSNQPSNQPGNQPNQQPRAAGKDEAPEREARDQAPDQARDQARSEEPAQKPAQDQAEPPQPDGQSQADGSALSNPAKSFLSNLSQTLSNAGGWLKWLIIAILAAIVLLYVVTHPQEIARLLQELVQFLQALFGVKRKTKAQDDVAPASKTAMATRVPFQSLANPFAQNLKGWSATRVVEHTFAAMEAWAAERQRPRSPEQTAEEFARNLVSQTPQLNKLPMQAAAMLDRVMFAGWKPSLQELEPLRELWQKMSASPVV
ncbi:MAG: DUF4129 domain-containing protein [Pirellulaceae bacterium]|nr:DUF4129 domain-containing protein [Pirellulaceae bacterium]